MLSKEDVERISSLWAPTEWPDFADKAYASAGHRLPFSYYVARIRHLGIAGDTLIDAGCGTGRWAFAFATVFNRVIGIDKTANRIATALWLRDRFEIPTVEFLTGDILAIPSEDNSVDAVYSNSVAIGGILLKDIFLESFRVLTAGGVFYVGLNGPGYGYSLIEHPDPAIGNLGRQKVYSTHCQIGLGRLPAELSPGGRLNEVARSRLGAVAGPGALLAAIGCSAAEIGAAQAIATDLGPTFTGQLMDELTAMVDGRQVSFSRERAGRDYEPEEVIRTAIAVGFERVEWASDGCLSLGPDGLITKAPCIGARGSPSEFNGRLRVYEALMWKPRPTTGTAGRFDSRHSAVPTDAQG